MKKIIVQIPAYNEEATIARVIKDIPRKINSHKVEVLVIDDGSSDKTSQVSKSAGAEHGIRNHRNLGLGVAFRKGIEYALKLGADIIVNIDADGQFNPKDIEHLIKPILENEADMVTTTRFLNKKPKNMPYIKKWGNRRFTNLVSRITGQKFTDTQCGFRAYSREAALKLNLFGKFTYTQEAFIDLVEKGVQIKEVPLEVVYHKERKSNISGKLSRYGFKSLGIIARATRDTQPMTFFGFPGFVSFILGCLGGLYAFYFWLTRHVTTPVRMLFNLSVFLVIFGISLAVLGLLADMMKRISSTQEEILYRLKKDDLKEKIK